MSTRDVGPLIFCEAFSLLRRSDLLATSPRPTFEVPWWKRVLFGDSSDIFFVLTRRTSTLPVGTDNLFFFK